MRLLNTTTLTLFEFHGSTIPPYAILSHRLEEAEVAFRDVQDRTNLTAYGWTKLQKRVTSPEKAATPSSGSTPAASTRPVPASRDLHRVPTRRPESSTNALQRACSRRKRLLHPRA